MDSIAQILVIVLALGLIILLLASQWKLFEKMGEEGWKGIIPIYNQMIIAKNVGKPEYWGVLVIIPYIGIIWGIWLLNLWLKRFGKDEGYTILTILFGFITIPMLAFGDAKWHPLENDEIKNIGDSNN